MKKPNDRKSITNTLSNRLYKTIQKTGLDLNVDANSLIEEGMLLVLLQYKNEVEETTKEEIEKITKGFN